LSPLIRPSHAFEVRARLARERVPVTVVATGDDVEHERGVPDRARDGPHVGHAGEAAREPAPLRHAPYDGLKPYTPQNRRGCESSRRRPCRAPAAAAARHADRPPPLEPPGVSAGFHGLRVTPKSGFLGDGLVTELRRVGLPEDERAGGPETRDSDRVLVGDVVGEEPRAAVVVSPRVKRTSLIETGTPWSGPSGSPFVTAISASARRGARLLGGDDAERVQHGV